MSLLPLLLLILPLLNCESVKKLTLEENVRDNSEETMCKSEKLNSLENKFEELVQRMERMDTSWKMEKAHLEKKLETKNVEVENLEKRVNAGVLQSAELESRMDEVMLSTQKSAVRSAVQKELDQALPDAVEQRLRDLPFEMVCAFQDYMDSGHDNSTVTYDRITVEFNNSNRPGGADGSMNIETGVFTTITSGY